MAEYKDREHYIPLRKSDLVDLLCADRGMTREAVGQMRRLATILSATFHFEYHKLLEELKDQYAPFNPDAATKTLAPLTPDERQRKLAELFERFNWLMERANFKRLGKEDLEKAAQEVSDWGLRMDVDFSSFENLAAYSRGEYQAMRKRRLWWKFWKLEERSLAIYQRLVLIVKLRRNKRVPKNVSTDAVFLKIFKEIPRMDAEMLLPGARLIMPGIARAKLGTSFLSGLGLIIYNILKGALLGVGYFWGLFVAVGGYGYKQYYGYQTTKTAINLQLTQSLYYQNLDNNAGVLTHLLDEAEEQECREALLAYYCLWRFAGDQGWTATALDDYVEMDLERLANIKVDFEIEDALAKLERLKLVVKNGDRYAAVPIDAALENLDYAWDNYFPYNNEAQARVERVSSAN